MQLVLLSGGSGKRLWPLSNGARSKQFLKLLNNENGFKESMVQRVIRQIKDAKLSDDITIATNLSQYDIITNQLGDSVDIVTEPERRDTFPAIALTASYFKYTKKCPDDEVIVVMPCDTFTDEGYYQTIGKMAKCVEANAADIVLMGITPTYPSEKYGYIVPIDNVQNCDYKIVKYFTEKPKQDKAEKLISENGLWNGGVFAFRLGYLMKIVCQHIEYNTFDEIRNHYSELPQISFDYEVVENSKSIAVIEYTGKWKDLGTWNTLSEELDTTTIGNAYVGAHCENTHIINELQIPLYADGVHNVIIAASNDGILVCAKNYTEGIKNVAEQLIIRPMYEERRWGSYRVLDNTNYPDGNHSLTKSITIKAGKNMSYHIHHHRSEVWTFVEGEGIFVLDGIKKRVKAGDTVIIPVGHYHAIKAISQLTFVEIQNGNPLVEEDIERFNWEWEK